MNYRTLILGSVPPLLAVIAELRNPVSARALRPEIEKHAEGLAAIPEVNDEVCIGANVIKMKDSKDVQREAQRRVGLIAEAMVRMSTAAAEVSAIIPTWISMTAGIVAVCAEELDPLSLAVGAAVWTAISSFIGFHFYSQLDYWSYGFGTNWRNPISGSRLTRQERLSCVLVGANLLVILVAVGAAFLGALRHAQVPTANLARPDVRLR